MKIAIDSKSPILRYTTDVCEADGTKVRYDVVRGEPAVDVPDSVGSAIIGNPKSPVKVSIE